MYLEKCICEVLGISNSIPNFINVLLARLVFKQRVEAEMDRMVFYLINKTSSPREQLKKTSQVQICSIFKRNENPVFVIENH